MKVSYLNDEFFSRLETLAVNLRTSLTGFFGGKHLVRSYGQTVEFADYREYMLGDDIRRIDWNLYICSFLANLRRFCEINFFTSFSRLPRRG